MTRDAENICDTEDLSNDSKLVIVPSFINEPNRITHGLYSFRWGLALFGYWLHAAGTRSSYGAPSGNLLFYTASSRRLVCERNISVSFPELTLANRKNWSKSASSKTGWID